MKDKIVITGGAGFIGSALVRSVLNAGAEYVTVIDNLLSGSEKNLAEVRSRVDFHNVDIRDLEAVKRVVAGADTVFHLAAIPSVPKSIDSPIPSHDVNANGTFNVYLASAQSGVRRVVYAASSSAYGDTKVLPKVETMSPSPISPYAVQKLLGEHYATSFHSCFGLETVSLRFFNVYGPRQDPSSPYSGVLSIFIRSIVSGKAPTIFGDGSVTRDFTFVEDVTALLLKAAVAPGVSGRVYNAGNGSRYSLNEVWDKLQEIAGVNIAANYGPPRPGDISDSQADTTAAVRDLKHNPAFSLEQGLRLTLDWYLKDLDTSSMAG